MSELMLAVMTDCADGSWND